MFVRLSKCNLRCYFCDTEFEKGAPMTAHDVVAKCRDLSLSEVPEVTGVRRTDLVVITGGEPLLQNIAPLVRGLNEIGMRVSVETAGAAWCSSAADLFDRVTQSRNKIVCSPKTAQLNRDVPQFVAAWKYIVNAGNTSEDDGLPIYSTQHQGVPQRLYRPYRHPAPIYVQPMDEGLVAKNIMNQRLAAALVMRYGYRLSLQMHKIVEVP